MTDLPFRTGASSLTDSELILLDVLFDVRCWFGSLRESTSRATFGEVWNLRYSHGLDDDSLRETLASLCDRGLLARSPDPSGELFVMTSHGGEIWSSERCPDWDRFCTDRLTLTDRGLTISSVIATTPEIRDGFLPYLPIPTARTRKTEITDYELLPWRSFAKLYVSVSIYKTCDEWSLASHDAEMKHRALIAEKRSWWRCISELQRFVGK